MFKIRFCNIYKFYEFKINNDENFPKSFLFIYSNDQEKIHKLGLIIDRNLNI